MTPKKANVTIEILTVADALQPQPPVDWIVDNLISAGSVNIFYGEGGSKKTWALLDMAVCVANGEEWIGFKTCKSNVLIIDEESGKRRILRRLGDTVRGHNADDQTPINIISLAGFDLGDKDWITELMTQIVVTSSKLIIIDALADVMPGRDENLVKDVQPIFRALRQIAEVLQVAIIIIHHANKSKGDYRGSTAIKGALDLLMQVESEPKSELITFKTTKARDTEPLDFAALAQFMTSVQPGMFWLISSAKPVRKKNYPAGQAYVLKYLLKMGNSSIENIENDADSCSSVAARKAVYTLVALSLVERTDAGGRGVKAEYGLTLNGQTEAQSL